MKECKKIIHYPIIFQFISIALIAFDIQILYISDIQTKLYCGIMFFVLINGWASSIDDDFRYGSLYLLVDALCCALYFLMLLYIRDAVYYMVWLISAIIALLYIIWNVLLMKLNHPDNNKQKELISYNWSNFTLLVFSVLLFTILLFVTNSDVQFFSQILGGCIWLLLIFKWYYDNYFSELKICRKI